MATNHTQNYQLNLWQKTDRFLMDDFNADNQKLDAALKADADAIAALAQVVSTKGNCHILFGAYTGNGEYGAEHPTVLTFDRPPQMVFLVSETGANMWMIRGQKKTLGYTPGYALHNTVTWSGNTVSFYGPDAAEQLTGSGSTFYYAALFLE